MLSWDEFSYQKGKLAFIAQDFNTRKIITILDNRHQTNIRNHFFKYSKEARNRVKIVTVDMSGSYSPLIKKSFPNTKLEATSKLIKDIKHNAFGYRNFNNFKKRIFLALNSEKEKTNIVSYRV